MKFADVFQVFIVINFASMSIGRSTSAMPDYKAAKAAGQRILSLCNRRSKIDPYEEKGKQLVNIEYHFRYDETILMVERHFRRVSRAALSFKMLPFLIQLERNAVF